MKVRGLAATGLTLLALGHALGVDTKISRDASLKDQIRHDGFEPRHGWNRVFSIVSGGYGYNGRIAVPMSKGILSKTCEFDVIDSNITVHGGHVADVRDYTIDYGAPDLYTNTTTTVQNAEQLKPNIDPATCLLVKK